MQNYDYSFLKGLVPSQIIGTAEIIADLRARGEVRKLQYTPFP